jgi:hypothetical protein
VAVGADEAGDDGLLLGVDHLVTLREEPADLLDATDDEPAVLDGEGFRPGPVIVHGVDHAVDDGEVRAAAHLPLLRRAGVRRLRGYPGSLDLSNLHTCEGVATSP